MPKINKEKPTLTEEVKYKFSPSELDYKAKKCKRCFYNATLNDGQAVSFEVGQGQKGPCANNVVPE